MKIIFRSACKAHARCPLSNISCLISSSFTSVPVDFPNRHRRSFQAITGVTSRLTMNRPPVRQYAEEGAAKMHHYFPEPISLITDLKCLAVPGPSSIASGPRVPSVL
ncbi:hypothetical protein PV02_05810 [Methanolobus chelungpuianus]|uniref:Uncharacterized protein n=1 Tax=Methanolobus chelungpuianus TaxID=502115 RepID=A0AAE3HAN0_9EURY|nr:hypothetical protein [Methanolobus chelungpuianus]